MLVIVLLGTFIFCFATAGARPAWACAEHNVISNATSPAHITSLAIPLIVINRDANSTANVSKHRSEGSGITIDSYISELPMFNESFPQKELKAVAVKYSQAAMYLKGDGLSPLPDFKHFTALLGDNDPTSQVAGSTYILSMETYGADISYYGQLELGAPPQPILFDIDTGSADLWASSGCSRCNPRKAKYDSTASSTYHDTGKPFALAYGTGEVEGTVARETVTLGQMSVSQQYFGVVSTETSEFSGLPFNGIIGMAFSSISAMREPTFMEQLIQERQSEVCIGCYDPSKYTGTISWNPVTSQTYWNIALNNIQVNGVDTSLRTITAAIDTGTSLIYLPQDIVDSFYNQIPGAARAPQYGPGLYSYPCIDRPAVSLVFGTQAHEINLQDFNLGKTTSSGEDCIGGILATGSNLPPGLAIIGGEFLKSWYSIYDYGQGSRVGFVKSINNR